MQQSNQGGMLKAKPFNQIESILHLIFICSQKEKKSIGEEYINEFG